MRAIPIGLCVCLAVLLTSAAAGHHAGAFVADRGATVQPQSPPTPSHPPVAGTTIFLYVSDIDRAIEFYGKTLGLRSILDRGPIRMFELGPSSAIGLIDAKTARGAAARLAKDKPLSLALVVDDIDRWYEYLKGRGVAIARPPRDSVNLNVRVFVFTDPEGYELEVITRLPDR